MKKLFVLLLCILISIVFITSCSKNASIREKSAEEEQEITKEKVKYTWYENLLFVLNVLIWPWKPSKKFKLKSNIYDNVLVAFVSSIMQIVGAFLWLFGILLVPLFYHL